MLTVAAFGDVFGDAEWVRDPVFDGVDVIHLHRKEHAPKAKLAGPKNVHTYFRTEIAIEGRPVSATAYVTGDDYYKLYVNGAFVVQGPESGYPFAHPFYAVDVTRHLAAGTNCLAAHVYYQGLYNRVWDSADNRSGFILALDVTLEDGGRARFVTDETWRCHGSIGHDTQSGEDAGLCEGPVGWREAGFDDGAWAAPLVRRQGHVSVANETLTEKQRAFLEAQGWSERAGDRLGVWVSVPDQRLRLVQGGTLVWQTACSTAAAGVGSAMNSYRTPLGWHSVAEKIGDGAPWGQVFREKRPIRRVWRPGEATEEDLVLTRVLPLAGEEPGKNRGGQVDSYARRIYVHGTNDEDGIGTPTSHGCIRLTNDDVIALYDRLPAGTPVLITE